MLERGTVCNARKMEERPQVIEHRRPSTSAHNVVSLCARIPVSSAIIIYRNPFLCKFKVFETRNNTSVICIYFYSHLFLL